MRAYFKALGVSILYILFILYRMRIRHWAPVIEKEPYVPLPEVIATPVSTEIDPRAEIDEHYDDKEQAGYSDPKY